MSDRRLPALDYELIFRRSQSPIMLLAPDLVIVAATDAYLQATMTRRESVLGRKVFEVFPDNPDDPAADGVANLRSSLERVLTTRQPDRMPIQKYDIRRPAEQGGGFEERYWSPQNTPILDDRGEVVVILHRVEDVTDLVRLRQRGAEQARSEAILRENLGWFSTTLASIGDAVIATDERGRIRFMNGVAGDLTGWDAGQAEGRPLDEVFRVVDEETGRPIESPVQHVLRDGQVVALANHTALLSKDGCRRPIEDTAAPIRGVGGEVEGVVLVFHDVSQKQAADLALREREELNRSIIASSPDLLGVITPDGLMEPMNATSGFLDEIDSSSTGRPVAWDAIWATESADLAASALQEARCGGLARFQARAEGGADRWWAATLTPIRDPDGGSSRVLAVIRDISEKRRSEVALLASEEFHRTLVDTMPQSAWMLGPDGTPLWYNRRWQEFTGRSEEELRIGTLRDFHHPDHYDRVLAQAGESLAAGIAWEVSCPLRSRDGSYRWFLCRTVPVKDSSGRILRWFGTATDVTHLMELEQEQREADRRKNLFLAMLGHELRNPVAAIRMASELIAAGGDSAGIADARDIIRRQTSNLGRLLDDLIDVSRITRGMIEVRKVPLDLAVVIDHAIETVRHLIEDKGHSLLCDVAAGLPRVEGDPVRLEQVVTNLISNACKYTPPGGLIRIKAGVDNGEILIQVADNGAGIDAADLLRVFDLFAQGARTLDRSEGGLGVGLTIVRELVERHGGRISAVSEGRGKGSEFLVRLPGMPVPAQDGSECQRTPRAGKSRILVVDDNRDLARSTAQILKLMGHEVELAFDGPEGIDAARRCHPDVVLMDIGLPSLDGYEVARTLRGEQALYDTLIVAVSGYAQEEDRRRSLEAGMDEHLPKPLDLGRLARLISDHSRR